MEKTVCVRHGLVDHKIMSDGRGKKKRIRCVQCLKDRKDRVRQKKLETLVALLGGKCVICDYNRCISCLDFHHLDRSTKIEKLSRLVLGRSFEMCLEEAHKCVLLCKICHTEIEVGYEETLKKFNDFIYGARSQSGREAGL